MLLRHAFLAIILSMACLDVLPAQASSSPTAREVRATSAADTGTSVVVGTVFDSVANAPLAHATVQLMLHAPPGSVYTAMTDSAGSFRLAGVGRGRYIAAFFHPALDALGVEPPMSLVEVTGDGETVLNLAIPSATTVAAVLCPRAAPGDSTGSLVGFVRDADTGLPLPGSTVVVIWNEIVVDQRGVRQERMQVPTTAGADGWYKVCDLPTDGDLIARAEQGADSSGFIQIRVPPRAVLSRNFGIGRADSVVAAAVDSAAQEAGRSSNVVTVRRGTARLTGVVRTADGRPVGGATVLLWESGLEGTTSEDGTFALSGLPAGTRTLEARYVGYEPARVTVDLSRDRTASVAVVLDTRAVVLDVVQVMGKRRRRGGVMGFLERRERGFGHFVTREDITKYAAVQVTDVLRRVPGVRVTPSRAFSYAVTLRGGCRPEVYLDGMRMLGANDETNPIDINTLVQPEQIAGIEVYTSLGGAPAEFAANGCGSIVIWTGAEAR